MSTPEAPNLDRLHNDLQVEYGKLVDIVTSYDQRLLTIKGWGVTLSMASLGIGFQQNHYGLFLVAAASGFAFWLLEAFTKIHQIHYYPRMRDIEVIAYELLRVNTPNGEASSPLIDWSWDTAGPRIRRIGTNENPSVPQPYPTIRTQRSVQPWTFTHVMFPHLVAIVMGTVLFVLGLCGVFGPI
jgi:hypothetical protein